MAKKPKPPGKKYNFMDTYGDLVTLLLCFFVLLFAMSTVEETKYNALVEALSARFGSSVANVSFVPEDSPDSGSELFEGDPTGDAMNTDASLPADLSQLEEKLNEFIEQNNMQGQVTIEKGPSGATFIRLSDSLLFGGDSSELRPETLAFLDFFSQCLTAIEGQILQVKFNGHTASIEGSSVDDWVLAAERAGRVSSYVSNIGGFSRFKISPVFYGRNYPIADNDTEEGRAKNRRVDIIVLGNDGSDLEATLADAMRVYFPTDDTQFFEGNPDDIFDPTTDIDNNGSLTDMLDNMSDEELQALIDDVAQNGATPAQSGAPAQSTPPAASTSG